MLLISFPQIFSQQETGRITKVIDADVDFLKDETANIVLLYFGYVGCGTVCLPALSEINTIYSQTTQNKDVSVYFVNLLTNIDAQSVKIFASQFNKDFQGIHLKEKDLKKITSKFNVVYTQSPIDDYEVNHAGFLYLLEKDVLNNKYKQKYIYTTRPYAVKNIIKDINILNKIKDTK